jgi:hypothetical protein
MCPKQDQEHGHAKIIRCLEDNLEQPGFNASCKAEVQKHAANAATDYRCAARLNTRHLAYVDHFCPEWRNLISWACTSAVTPSCTERFFGRHLL